MFDDLRMKKCCEKSSEGNTADCVIANIRQVVETVAEAFRMIEFKYNLSMKEILDFLEQRGYPAEEILYNHQEKIDSDIYGRVLARTADPEEIETWLTEAAEWQKEACFLAEEFKRLYAEALDKRMALCE